MMGVGDPEEGPRTGGGLAGIVLAGGRARRFGSDKLAADLGGRPVVWRTVASLAPLVRELVVVTSAGSKLPELPTDPLASRPTIVRDELPDAGPLAAMLTGLRAVASERAVVLGGDMPFARRAILELLAGRLEPYDPGTLGAALLDGPLLRPLPLAVLVGPARVAAETLVGTGERSLRSLTTALRVAAVEEAVWRTLDPDAGSLRDVDTRADLAELRHLVAAHDAPGGRGPG
jgi:molybdenum cofactor guanylyltransferase